MPQNHILFSGKWISFCIFKGKYIAALFQAVSISYFNRINLHIYFDFCLSLCIVMIGYTISV